MNKREALLLVRDMVAERYVDACRRLDGKARDEWLMALDRIEREWPWLQEKRRDIGRLKEIPDK